MNHISQPKLNPYDESDSVGSLNLPIDVLKNMFRDYLLFNVWVDDGI